MVDINQIKNIYLYGDGVSFRYGIRGLSNLILSEFTVSQAKNSMFVFFSRNGRQIKMIEFDDTGTWMYQKNLKGHRFVFPSVKDGNMQIDKRQLLVILQNIKNSHNKAKKIEGNY